MEKVIISCSGCGFKFVTTKEFLPKVRFVNNNCEHIDLISVPLSLQCPKCLGIISVEVKNETEKSNE